MKLNTLNCISSTPPNWALATLDFDTQTTVSGVTVTGTTSRTLDELPAHIAGAVGAAMGEIIGLNADWLCIQASIHRADITAFFFDDPETDQPTITPNFNVTLAVVDAATKTLHGNLRMQTRDHATLHTACELLESYGVQFTK